jgi:hypothetical protein
VRATSPAACPWAAQIWSISGGGSARAPRGRSRADAESVVDPELQPKSARSFRKARICRVKHRIGEGSVLVKVEGVAAHLHGLGVLEAETPEKGRSTAVSEIIRRS